MCKNGCDSVSGSFMFFRNKFSPFGVSFGSNARCSVLVTDVMLSRRMRLQRGFLSF